MEHNYDDILVLERYLDRSLTDEEAREVEKRLSEDPGFKELYLNEKLLVDGIHFSHLKTKLEQLRNLEAGLPPLQTNATRRSVSWENYWKPLAAAAALAVLTATFLLWRQPMDSSALYAMYFKPYPNVFEPAVRGTLEQNERAETFSAYEHGDYRQAAAGFRQMLKSKEDPAILLLLGNANLMLGQPGEAKENFITLSKDFDELDLQAKWYLSLCYLKMAERDSARVLLEEIAGGDGSYKDKAKELLKKVD